MTGAGANTGESLPTAAVEGWFAQPQGTSFSGESSSESDSENSSATDTESEVPVFVPIPVKELGSEAEWSREEKVSRVVQTLKMQQQRHCFVKIDTEPTQPMKVPLVRRHALESDMMLEYREGVYSEQGALPAAEVDRIIDAREAAFLTVAAPSDDENFAEKEIPIKPRNSKKKRTRLGAVK